MTNVARNNKIFYIVASALRSASLLCASGPLMQTLIEVLGLSSRLNYIHTTLLQIVNVLTTVLCSKWADRGNVMKRMMLVQMPYGLMFLFYLPVCVLNDAPLEIFVLLLTVGIFQTITIALSTICEYKQPYFIFDPDDYAPVMAISGIISGVFSMGFSSLISGLTSRFDYKMLMLAAFIVSAVFAMVSGILYSLQKPLIDMDSIQQKKDDKKIKLQQVFSHPAFYKLFVANLCRGFATGTTAVLAIVAFDIGFDKSVSTMMVPLSSAAMFAGCAISGIVSIRVPQHVQTFFGSLVFLLLPLLFIQNKMVFFVVYTVILLGRNIVDISIPAALLRVVPAQIAGPYNAWRMIVNNVGNLIATSVASMISPALLFAIAIISQLVVGVSFFRFKGFKKQSV